MKKSFLDDPELGDTKFQRLSNSLERKQIIPPIVFFGILIVIFAVSVHKHNQEVDEGVVDLTQNAMNVQFLTQSVGTEVYHNNDELSQSFEAYFYLGIEYCELETENVFYLWDHDGIMMFEGSDEKVETFHWTCTEDGITQEEIDEMIPELVDAFGEPVQAEDGVYWWHSTPENPVGYNEPLAWMSFGLDENGTWVVEGSCNPE